MKPLLFLVLLFPLAAVAQLPNTERATKKEEASIAGMVVIASISAEQTTTNG